MIGESGKMCYTFRCLMEYSSTRRGVRHIPPVPPLLPLCPRPHSARGVTPQPVPGSSHRDDVPALSDRRNRMGIGASLVLIAVGAILRFAVNRQEIAGTSVGTVGVILIVVGLAGLIITLSLLAMRRRTDVVVRRDGGTYYDAGAVPRRTRVIVGAAISPDDDVGAPTPRP